ncbi:MAG: DUF2281 domain-containing protein [Methanolinea sp.]
MEGIAEKISRLPPERQREIEDFVDFLLSRQSPREKPGDSPDFLIIPPTQVPSKPIILADEIPFRRDPDILPDYADLGHLADPGEGESKKDSPPSSKKARSFDPGKKLLDWID